MSDDPNAREVTVVQLADETIDALAHRLADLLAQAPAPTAPGRSEQPAGLMTATEVSAWWGVERAWVYDHADQLGAIRLGTGRRPRLRFDPARVAQAMRGEPAPAPTNTGRSPANAVDRTTRLGFHQKPSYGRKRP